MHYHQIVILVVCCLIAFGIYSLPEMRKNEFPNFVVRQGIVAAAAPGLSPQQISDQVAKPLQEYVFTYKEIKKQKTTVRCRDGMAYIQVELNDDLHNKDEFWSKFKHGINAFKAQLPKNVLAVLVLDDFGDTSALLITMESSDKTYSELSDYADDLRNRLSQISSVGRITVKGEQEEQISVVLDNDRLSKYSLNDRLVALSLMQQGFVTTGGKISDGNVNQPIYVKPSLNSVRDIQNQIIFSDPQGGIVRLKDIAEVKKEYPKRTSYITNNGKKCIVVSVEMKSGENIVKMGRDIDAELVDFQKHELPAEVSVFRITDQSQVVGDSVNNFIRELLIAIIAVVIVVMLLLPIRTALVAASTIPVSIFISLGLFYAFDIELNTVTLAALIVTLGMIVDNSIVIIDSYLEQIGEGVDRMTASVESARHFFKSILSATMAISITFFPFLLTTVGMMNDFLQSFPWAVTIVLGVSLMIAVLLVPFLQYFFIRKPMKKRQRGFSFLDLMQRFYEWLIDSCFRVPKLVLLLGLASIVVGGYLLANIKQQILPYADRNQFAVEIYAPAGTAIERTAAVADSLEHILRRDDRVVSVASFKGMASPRFQTSYAPQIAGENYTQFIVNTKGVKETVSLLQDYADKYADAFSGVDVRFKQLSYSAAVFPVEVRLSGYDTKALLRDAAIVQDSLRRMPELKFVHTDFGESQPVLAVSLKDDEAARLGVSNFSLESSLALRYGGVPVATVWEGDKAVPVVVKSTCADSAAASGVANELVPAAGGLANVPLRQVADVEPDWQKSQFVTRGGVPTITVMADVRSGINVMDVTKRIVSRLDNFCPTSGVTLSMGGELEDSQEKMPAILQGLAIAAVIIFFILLVHFRKISESLIIFGSMMLCLLGTAVGLMLHSCAFSVTSILGVTSLMGIIVRNGIIMFDYSHELIETGECSTIRDAILNSAKRRMRPIFLTSAAASMGVVPMILGGSGLWKPMGCVVCYGTLITMVFLLTVLPVAYWQFMPKAKAPIAPSPEDEAKSEVHIYN